jgi:NADPH2:quinone reductase
MLPVRPAILGNGVGGTVIGVGADADPGLLGRRVVSALGGQGGYPERAAAPAAGLIEIPNGLLLRDAVALLADGLPQAADAHAAIESRAAIGKTLLSVAPCP